MPRAATTKRTVKKKDAVSELQQGEELLKEKNNFWSCTAPITINYHYLKKRKTEIPENPTNHWTQNKNDERWLYLWHLEQKIGRLQFEFHKTAKWNEYRKINPLIKAKQTLLEEGIITETITPEELHKLYYCTDTKVLKNYNNHYFQGSYYEKPEEGEILEEITSSQGKRIRYGGYQY